MTPLTGPAGDQRLLPLAAGQTPDHGAEGLDEAVHAVVAHQRVGLVARPLPPKQPGVGNVGGGAAGSCEREDAALSWGATPSACRAGWKRTHRRPSCRCRTGGSCTARRSTGPRPATPSLHSPPQTGSSCQAGLCASSHRAGGGNDHVPHGFGVIE